MFDAWWPLPTSEMCFPSVAQLRRCNGIAESHLMPAKLQFRDRWNNSRRVRGAATEEGRIPCCGSSARIISNMHNGRALPAYVFAKLPRIDTIQGCDSMPSCRSTMYIHGICEFNAKLESRRICSIYSRSSGEISF